MPKLFKCASRIETITIAELIAELQKYPPEMAIAYTWEGQILPVVLDKIEVMQDSVNVNGPLLLLDAET